VTSAGSFTSLSGEARWPGVLRSVFGFADMGVRIAQGGDGGK
jgi:hypothetical protein